MIVVASHRESGKGALVELVLLLLLATGCGSSAVGGQCSQASDCPSAKFDGGTIAAICLQGAATPGGYCALPCASAGTQDVCPAGAFCTAFASGTYCAHVCQSQSDCRAGYNCNGITGTTIKTCQ